MKIFTLALILFTSALPVFSQWNRDTTVNNIVANSSGNETVAASVTDGANGSIIFMQDNNSYYDIFAQRITSTGAIAWGSTASPVAVCVTDAYKEEGLVAIPDGSGGAFVTWSDYRFDPEIAEIYIQRINSAGAVQWGPNGLRVTNSPTRNDETPVLCADGAGGVIVSWYYDDTINKNDQAYAQRYNSAGVAQWASNGVQVCTAPGFRASSAIVSDGSNGAIIFFADTRNDPHGLDYDYLNSSDTLTLITNADIYAQRLNGSGARQWTNNGAAIITASGNQLQGIAMPDGAGGAVLVFDDGRNDDGKDTNNDIFAQRVNGSGGVQWAAKGVALTTAAGNQYLTAAVADGMGGFVAVFANASANESVNVLCQRVTTAGVVSWAVNGIKVSQADDYAYSSSIIADGTGNTVIAFGTYGGNNIIRAQKLSSSGASQWGVNGATISHPGNGSPDDPLITTSDNGSVIIAWNDNRDVTFSSDVYASKVLANGTLAGAAVNSYVTAANGNWSNPSTWTGGVVPPPGAAVVIKNMVSCNVNASCTSLTVQQPAGNLTVLTGFKITLTK